jgi:hypothetical protein
VEFGTGQHDSDDRDRDRDGLSPAQPLSDDDHREEHSHGRVARDGLATEIGPIASAR